MIDAHYHDLHFGSDQGSGCLWGSDLTRPCHEKEVCPAPASTSCSLAASEHAKPGRVHASAQLYAMNMQSSYTILTDVP